MKRTAACIALAVCVSACCGLAGCGPAEKAATEVVFRTEITGFAEAVVEVPGGGYLLVGTLIDENASGSPWIGGVGADGQGPWYKSLDGEELSSATVAPDGTILVCGSQWLSYGSVGWVMSVDAEGNEEWSRTFREGEQAEQVGDQWVWTSTSFAGIRPTADGGYVVAGHKAYSAWSGDITLPFEGFAWLIAKYDSQGTEEWSQLVTGTSDQGGIAFSVEPTADGGYVVVGYLDERPLVVKLTVAGEVEWTWPSGDQAGEPTGLFCSVCALPDGSCVACGYRGSYPHDVSLVRLDTDGGVVWLKTFGLPENSDAASAVLVTRDGNLLVCGSRALPEDAAEGAVTPQAWLRKVDLNGDELWVKAYGADPGGFSTITVTSEAGYAAAGRTYPPSGETFPWLVLTDSDGN